MNIEDNLNRQYHDAGDERVCRRGVVEDEADTRNSGVKDERVCRRSGVADGTETLNSGVKDERVCRRSGVADGTETRNSGVKDERVCIFICVFNQLKYVEMFLLSLKSILKYGELDSNTDILIYTSTQFMNIIKETMLKEFVGEVESFTKEFDIFANIKFEIADDKNDIDKACKARLDLFNLPSIVKYKKFLYLDTDILIKGSISSIFNLVQEDVLYVLEEGEINSDTDWWGNSLFGDDINLYEDKTAFTSGIMLFRNCEKMKFLFKKIIEDSINRNRFFVCYDQPYIIFNAFKYQLYNNKILKSYVVNNDYNINSDKIIHHFPGNPGVYHHKIEKMNSFLFNLESK